MSRSSLETRASILDAANRIVLSQGVEHLTLEAAANEAGVSKGGLLYHFPNKEMLIAGMIEHYIQRFMADLHASAKTPTQSSKPGSWTRAYLDTTFADNQRLPRMSSGLLAAIATNPSLLKPLQDIFAEWVKLLEDDGIEPVTAHIVRLVSDGLWLVELFDLAPPSSKMKERISQALKNLIANGSLND